jgi:hypothetical protein
VNLKEFFHGRFCRETEQTRQETIHLIVHQDSIFRDIRELTHSGRNPEYLERLTNAFGEIEKLIGLSGTRNFATYDRRDIALLIGKADLVVLYGCHRGACLGWVTEEVIAAGAAVAWSIKGTV